MKTLGQIAYAVWHGGREDDDWSSEDRIVKKWEAAANAVRRECITTLQKRYMGSGHREDQEVLRCIADLEALK